MSRTRRSPAEISLWVALGLLAVLAVAWRMVPVSDAAARVLSLPLEGLTFRGQDVPLDPVETNHFAGVTLLKRQYQAGPHRISVLVVDGTRNRHAVHDPAYCFRGGGWEAVSSSEIPMLGGRATRQVFRRGNESRDLVFWFSDGKSRYSSLVRHAWDSALRRITFGRSGEAPVLISLQASGDPSPDWDVVLQAIPPLNAL
jgi:Protein of unknown function (DUF3485)